MNDWIKRNTAGILALIIVGIGLSVGAWFLCDLSKEYSIRGDGVLKTEESAQVGEFMAGVVGTIFALAGFVVVFLTYKDQVRANEKEKIENRFYTLLKIHIDNSNNLTYHNPYNNGR